jgi:hypothetical protein
MHGGGQQCPLGLEVTGPRDTEKRKRRFRFCEERRIAASFLGGWTGARYACDCVSMPEHGLYLPYGWPPKPSEQFSAKAWYQLPVGGEAGTPLRQV